ncbi:MAG: FG-GAP repeat domain-containing protein [Thermoanaerobaculia bacterium]
MSVLFLVTARPGDAQDAAKSQDAGKNNAAATATQKIPDGGMPHWIRPETPEERLARIATTEDPGLDPDPEKIFIRFGREYKILKFDKKGVRPAARPGLVRPHPNLNLFDEMYQENEKWVWVWVAKPVKRTTAAQRAEAAKYDKFSNETLAYFAKIRDDFEPLEPPKSSKKVKFEASSNGLPTSGSWRNHLAVADMNGDKFVDLIVPSQRGGESGTPTIFLGDGKGGWKQWNSVKWPGRIDYGGVAAADFNKDKKMDVAFAIHLKGLLILLGDGKGGFTVAHREDKFASRRILTTDVDGDGWTDVVALWEGPLARGADLRADDYSSLRAYLNRDKGQKWEGVNLSDAKRRVSGDWLAAGNFNGDKRPDFIGSSMYYNSIHNLYLSDAEPAKYTAFDDPEVLVFPQRATYYAVTAAPFSSKTLDDLIVTSVRRWPARVNPELLPPPPLQGVVSLDRVSFVSGKAKRTPVMRYEAGGAIAGLNHGDFDGDGNEDLMFTREIPREAVLLLGDGKGGFERAQLEGLVVAPQRNYDLGVADVNGDGRPDVILMYEAQTTTALAEKNGSIQVFLNRGVAR